MWEIDVRPGFRLVTGHRSFCSNVVSHLFQLLTELGARMYSSVITISKTVDPFHDSSAVWPSGDCCNEYRYYQHKRTYHLENDKGISYRDSIIG
jgi:hypothetical protein